MPFPVPIECVGAPNVSDWPETAQITGIDFRVNDLEIWHSKQGSWPDVHVPGWGDGAADTGNIQWTLWPVIRVDDRWLTTGCIEFWIGRRNVGGPFSSAAKDWYYWEPQMAGHQPGAGEKVGFFVTAGDHRRKDFSVVQERSAVVWVTVPANDTGTFHFDTAPVPAVEPVPVPVPPLAPVPVPEVPHPAPVPQVPMSQGQMSQLVTAVLASFKMINAKLDKCATHTEIAALQTEIKLQGDAIVAALSKSGGVDLSALSQIFRR